MMSDYLCDIASWNDYNERCFNALLEYEINTSVLYDVPEHLSNILRIKIPKHERMDFFAFVWGVDMQRMKNSWKEVEYYINRMTAEDIRQKFNEIRIKYFKDEKEETKRRLTV